MNLTCRALPRHVLRQLLIVTIGMVVIVFGSALAFEHHWWFCALCAVSGTAQSLLLGHTVYGVRRRFAALIKVARLY